MKDFYDNCKYCGGPIDLVNQKYNLVKCQNCYLVFSKVIFQQKEFEETYDKLYNDKNPKYKLHTLTEYEQIKKGVFNIGYNRRRIIHNNVFSDAQILEVGSGNGLMGCYIRHQFPKSIYTGIELDREISEKAKSFGLNIITGDFSVMETLEKKYDMVFMWEVLEHIQDLKKCIKLIEKRLKPEGKFIFSVPNYDKRTNYRDFGDSIFQDAPPIHLNFFTRENVEKIFSGSEFKILKINRKKLPYFNVKSLKEMSLKILTFKYEGPTLFCVLEKV